MRHTDDHGEILEDPHAEAVLDKLLHLKGYERPESARLNRNKQNIMRVVRQTEDRSWRLDQLLEMNIPWFFAEPRYGIALLFVVFAALQFLGFSGRQSAKSLEPYAVSPGLREQVVVAVDTNSVVYPELPNHMKFFPKTDGAGEIRFVGQTLK